MTIRDQKTKDSFITYLEEHPQERFWQALRNWSKYNFIYGSNYMEGELEDTFYLEEE